MLNTNGGLSGLVQSIATIFNAVLLMLTALAVVLFFVGVIKYIYSNGAQKRRETLWWSMVALFVLLSVWGILRIMCNTLTGSSSCRASSVQTQFTGGVDSIDRIY